MKPNPPLILCYHSVEVSALAHDLPLKSSITGFLLCLSGLGNHFPVLHTMLGPKRPSQGHMPHVHCPCVLECQGTMQGVLSSSQSPPRKLVQVPSFQVVPSPTWIYWQFSHPSSLRTQASGLSLSKGTVPVCHQYPLLLHSFPFSLSDQEIWIFYRAGKNSQTLIGFISSSL